MFWKKKKKVKKLISKAFCEEGNIENNGSLAYAKEVLFPLLEGKPFLIARKEEHGGAITFNTYEEMEKAFADRSLWPGDLKLGVTDGLNKLLEPVRTKFSDPAMQDLLGKAYPVVAEAKKEKPAKAKKEKANATTGEGKKEKAAAPKESAPKESAPKESAPKEKKEKAPKAAKPAKPAKGAAAGAVGPPWDVSALKIVVGTILKAWPHPDSDKLWCEEIDCGEEQPRQIASGLRQFYPDVSALVNRKVLVLANLKARKLAGFPSNGMVLCASNADHTEVKFAEVPGSTPNGEQVKFPGFDGASATPQQVDKKKIFEEVKDGLVVAGDGTCTYNGTPFTTSGGNCTAPGMAGSHIA